MRNPWWHPGWLLQQLRRPRREQALLRWNVKVLGSALAQQQAIAQPWTMADLPEAPLPAGLTSRVCRQADIDSPWLRHWCRVLHTAPNYHRKLWEDGFALQALWEAGMLAPGKRGLGFAVGRELLPAVLAASGAEVLATDLPAGDARARVWIGSNQHVAAPGAAREPLFHPHLIDRAGFEARVAWRDLDMRRIPAELHGRFDFLWSVCAFEHLGALRHGLDFVVEAMRCLKPGGVAVHTTEYNLDPSGGTMGHGRTVLYQRHHLAGLAARLAKAGHRMLPLEEVPDATAGLLDRYVDLPPFAEDPGPLGTLEPPHLRLALYGYPATSAGLVIQAGGGA